jgi:hypothetical protein
MWKYFIHFIFASMLVGQLALIGLLALKQSKWSSPALIPLLIVTILFVIFMNADHSHVSEFLPTRNCIMTDSENNAAGPMNMDFVKGAYLQPSLQNRSVEPDYFGDADDGLDDYHRP